MAEDRAEAVCPGLGKTLSSSPDLGISLSTVSVYQHTLFYPNTRVEINEEILIGLSAGQSLSIIIRQLTMGTFASDLKEGIVPFLSRSRSASCRSDGCCRLRAQVLRGLGDAAGCRRTDRPGRGGSSPSAQILPDEHCS